MWWMFVDAGASLNIKDKWGQTALTSAQDKKKENVVEILKAAGGYHEASWIRLITCYIGVVIIQLHSYFFHSNENK